MYWAAKNGHLEIVKWLHSENPNKRIGGGCCQLFWNADLTL